MLAAALALILWTLVVWAWMYATRIPAMREAKVSPQEGLHPGSLDKLPTGARVVADNYNHLHEQPTIFYALAMITHLAGHGDAINVALAWGYFATRVAHSIAQIVLKRVVPRFLMFIAGTVILMVIAGRDAILLFAPS